MNLPKFSIDNHVLLNILLATLMALGVISISRLPREQFAEVPFYWANITVPWPGAGADDMERSVTIEIEKAMAGLDKLKGIQSVTGNGLSLVRVEFDDGIDTLQFERLFQDVNTRLSRVVLPEGTLEPNLSDFSSNDFLPVIQVGLRAVEGGTVSREALYKSAQRLSDRIASIPDVQGVEAVGQQDRLIFVEADRDKLENTGIALSELARAIQQKNVSIPAGRLETETREYLLRTVGSFEGIADIDRLIVRRNGTSGSIIHVGDLARVVDGYADDAALVRLNGEEAIVLRVTKVPQGDAISIIEALKGVLASGEVPIEEGVSVSLLNDSTTQIRDSIDVLVTNAIQGLVLLTLILFFFVGLRNAIMTAFGIPVTFAISFIILEYTGETLNSNTLFGLVLVLGMIVDHGIVLIENAIRWRGLGLDRREAAIRGTKEVMWPIIASALTTIAAFLPLILLPGTIGKFLRVIPVVVTVSLAVSTLESLLFIPSHFVHWPGSDGDKRARFFEPLQRAFERLSRRLYARRGLVFGSFALLTIGIFSTLAFVRIDLFSAEDYSLFYIDIEMPVGATRSETARVAGKFEEAALAKRGRGEILDVITTIESGSASRAELLVDLAERDEGRERSITAIMDELRDETRLVPGADRVSFRKAQSGPPVSAPIGYRLRGDDYTALADGIAGIRDIIATYPVAFNTSDSLEAAAPELRIRVNEERAAANGLSVQAVGAAIRAAYDGIPAGAVFLDNEEFDVVVRYPVSPSGPSAEGDRPTGDDRTLSPLARLETLQFTTSSGRKLPFSSVASIELADGLASIKRIDGKREASIEADSYDTRQIPVIDRAVERWFNEEFKPLHPDVELVKGGEFSEFADLLVQILRVFLLGLFLIYAILGAQFKSYTQPFLILISIPMAFAGVFLYLAISGTPFSTTVMYAAVALAGIAVNDTIVLIDFINTRRKEGQTVADAVVEAASTRLRPILLTSVTTIAGLLPTAIGFGGYSVVWSPMASTIIFGLVFSTATALLVIPSFYGLLFDRKKRLAPSKTV